MKLRRTESIMMIWVLALLVSNSHAVGQEKRADKALKQARSVASVKASMLGDGTFKFLSSKFALGKTLKGAPYSATATTETIQTLGDGNQIIRKNEATVYRDGEGRVRVDRRLQTIGKWSTGGEPLLVSFISDPVSGVHYDLDSTTKTAYKRNALKEVRLQKELETLKVKLKAAEATYIKVKAEAGAADESKKPARDKIELKKPSDDSRRKVESLGRQMIEGVEVEGSRTTVTIPAGEIGNTMPIEIVSEHWFSPDLKIMVMSKSRDPRSGETTYTLTDISRGEPDRSLFEVPVDYTIVDESDRKKAVKKFEGKKKASKQEL